MTITERIPAVAILLAALCALTSAQEIKRPPIQVPEAANAAAKLVPRGWRLENETLKEADLNGDGAQALSPTLSQWERQFNTNDE